MEGLAEVGEGARVGITARVGGTVDVAGAVVGIDVALAEGEGASVGAKVGMAVGVPAQAISNVPRKKATNMCLNGKMFRQHAFIQCIYPDTWSLGQDH